VLRAAAAFDALGDHEIATQAIRMAATLNVNPQVAGSSPDGPFETPIRCCIDITNERPRPFKRTKTTDEILASVARFCLRIANSGHAPLTSGF
jgi:hypothetical protein